MKTIFFYLREYFAAINKVVLVLATVFIAAAIFLNYHFDINGSINERGGLAEYAGWYIVFFTAFATGYALHAIFNRSDIFSNKKFLLLLIIAPAIFSWKMVYPVNFYFTADFFANDYWNHIVYWPMKIAVVAFLLGIIAILFPQKDVFYGVQSRGLSLKPYLLMLLVMLPLIAWASSQPDFLAMYPKYQKLPFLAQPERGWYKLLFELSYGSDFFTIELFFRGFLVLAFARWAGRDAILPMALFYCTIHFGKPVGECISSYFGGIILGVVILNTRSLFGGLLVHLGIAWLMELGGYLGHLYR